MSVIVRPTPEILAHKRGVPFKLFVPRELEEDAAYAGWNVLRALENVVLADPFAMPGISTVFPGVIYTDEVSTDDEGLQAVAAALTPAINDYPEAYEDSWIEAWVPDAYEPIAEALDITDLTQG